MKVEQNGSNGEVTFPVTNDWSLFYYGPLTITEKKEAELKGTFTGRVDTNLKNPGTKPEKHVLGIDLDTGIDTNTPVKGQLDNVPKMVTITL